MDNKTDDTLQAKKQGTIDPRHLGLDQPPRLDWQKLLIGVGVVSATLAVLPVLIR
jgi:hypothetical protein